MRTINVDIEVYTMNESIECEVYGKKRKNKKKTHNPSMPNLRFVLLLSSNSGFANQSTFVDTEKRDEKKTKAKTYLIIITAHFLLYIDDNTYSTHPETTQ